MKYPRRITTLSTEAVGDGLAVLDGGRKQSYVLNATSALVFQHCDGRTSPEQLAELLRQKFNLPQGEAEQLTRLALEEMRTANLLDPGIPSMPPPAATFSRRQALASFAAAGLSLALLPIITRVAQAQAGSVLVPLLECVDNNGDGTYTAHFGYLNAGSSAITLPVGPKNMFVGGDKDRGQPTVFYPGEHLSQFTVVFDALDTLKWMLKADGDRRHQVEASATSEVCTTTEPTTTT